MPQEIYEVKSGDTLWKIVAKEFSLKSDAEIHKKVKEIAQKNKINGNSIFIGQKINLETNGQITTPYLPEKNISEPTNNLSHFSFEDLDLHYWNNQFDSIFVNKYVYNVMNAAPNIDNFYSITNTKPVEKTSTEFNTKTNNTNATKNYNRCYTDEEKKILIEKGIYSSETIENAEKKGRKRLYSKEDIELIKNTKKYSKSEILSIAEQEARKYGINPVLIKAIIQTESTYKQFNKSRAGARGLMQIMPITIKHWSDPSRLNLDNANPFDAKQNIQIGVKHFADLLKKFKGNIRDALSAYNCGETNYRKYKKGQKNLAEETRRYPTRVLNNTNIFGERIYA